MKNHSGQIVVTDAENGKFVFLVNFLVNLYSSLEL